MRATGKAGGRPKLIAAVRVTRDCSSGRLMHLVVLLAGIAVQKLDAGEGEEGEGEEGEGEEGEFAA